MRSISWSETADDSPTLLLDLDTGKHLFTIEHEVRSATHPMFMRPLVNRNPEQTNRTYAPGHEQWAWAMGPDEYDRR